MSPAMCWHRGQLIHHNKLYCRTPQPLCSGEEITVCWRAREQVIFDPFKNTATNFSFEVRDPGNVKGLTFFVTHPAKDREPKLVKPTQAGSPQPQLVRIDAYRSALIFKDVLTTGRYAYSLEF